ncbi:MULTISPECIES: class I SAM-dependent methyltransferase [unclassified Oleiphilus]|jgi:23S rRNA (cytosine1962-C5)-methyltransferase|nr:MULTISPECIES: class I SAM-dependent methyltransferase [unclassified Oleiphilus]KZY46113.1 hypothetical protein A3732_08015 [Oleiphilus sp. HI0050]KZY79567.1 hypothetical protein A3740_06995 [Oleiphilus sp. HI0068]KZY80291.1 hypothetical protein A3741_05720 [Oleiphilus sp. HI0069]KZY96029.1 hypothetical protein A3743_04905 [Oleiphilus sp. HI0072]KZZ16668.1 hypothetical protein A3749_04450 [Oleiphilus sp. HI0078]
MSAQTNDILQQELLSNLSRYQDRAARVFHGRGKYFEALSSLNIEWYPPYLFVQNFSESLSDDIAASLKKVFDNNLYISAIIIQTRSWPELETSILYQRSECELPIEHTAKLSDKLKSHVSLGKNRNTGVFLDMRAGWQWVEENAQDKSVLNLFSYTSIFSLFALEGGAKKVINMDMSAGALRTAQRNHNLNGISQGKANFVKRDILKSRKQFSSYGPFDLIITDPPPYQKKAFRGWQDYKRLLGWCKDCLNENGTLLVSLNNPHVTHQQFKDELGDCFPETKEMTIIDSCAEIKENDPSKGLKLIAVSL